MTIFEAAVLGKLKELKKLIKDGADVNAKDNYGWTAMMMSAWNGHTECVAALISAGTDVNANDNYGNTAILLAAWDGNKDCVKLLKKAGAK